MEGLKLTGCILDGPNHTIQIGPQSEIQLGAGHELSWADDMLQISPGDRPVEITDITIRL